MIYHKIWTTSFIRHFHSCDVPRCKDFFRLQVVILLLLVMDLLDNIIIGPPHPNKRKSSNYVQREFRLNESDGLN